MSDQEEKDKKLITELEKSMKLVDMQLANLPKEIRDMVQCPNCGVMVGKGDKFSKCWKCNHEIDNYSFGEMPDDC